MGRPHSLFRHLFRLFLVAGMALGSSLACQRRSEGASRPPLEVTVAYPTNISAALALIAIDKGHFLHRGARWNYLPFETGKAALEQLLAGKADVAIASETPIARAILAGGKFKILASIEQSGLDVRIVARRDRGIEAPRDLRGKVIGFTRDTSGHYFLDSWLLANGLDQSEIRLADLSPIQSREALIAGTVDAVATWDPHAQILSTALGGRAVVFQDEFLFTQVFCVVGRPEFIREHPDQVKAILEGLLSAKNLLRRAPEESLSAIARLARADAGLVAKTLPAHEFDVMLDQSLLVVLENECRWMRDTGATPGLTIPDLYPYLHLPGLLEVNPRKVQVIRRDLRGSP